MIRPTYIVGPGDHTDRFTYWPVAGRARRRDARAGHAEDPIQFIDVRDLAEFMRLCVEQRIPGRYNLCNPPGAVTMGDVLETSKRVTKANTTFRWASRSFLEATSCSRAARCRSGHRLRREAGAALVSSARAVAKGCAFAIWKRRSDTVAWHEQRPAEQQQKLRAGLTPEREAELLKKLAAVMSDQKFDGLVRVRG